MLSALSSSIQKALLCFQFDIPSKRMYFFTSFNTTELNECKTKHGTKGVDDELLKCTGCIWW